MAGANLVGVTDATPELSLAAAARLGAEQQFTDTAQLIEHASVRVVHVCTPNHLHAGLVEMALAAGKHVVCEKPLAMTANDALHLTEMANSSQAVAAVPFAYCYEPLVAEARERILKGELGRINLIHGSYLQDWLLFPSDGNWRVDSSKGGASRAFADIGSHWCHLAEWITGHRITELAAATAVSVRHRASASNETFAKAVVSAAEQGQFSEVETEDLACLVFRTEQGALGTLAVSQVSAGRKNRLWIEVDGSESGLAFNEEDPQNLWIGRRSGIELVPRDPALLAANARRLSVLPAGHSQSFVDNFVGLLSDVYSAVRWLSGDCLESDETGQQCPAYPTFADGLRAARITEAVLQSASERRWVTVRHDMPLSRVGTQSRSGASWVASDAHSLQGGHGSGKSA
jgi:predicted dehydrogenase